MIRFLLTFLYIGVFSQGSPLNDFYSTNIYIENLQETLLSNQQETTRGLILQQLFESPEKASESVAPFLSELGFEFDRINKKAPYNYQITKIPADSFMATYINVVLKLGGKVILVFDEPIQGLVSRAEPDKILLDPIRFLRALTAPLSIVPHEVTHFIHFQGIKNSDFKPYNSRLFTKEPALTVYKDTFALDEIEAHFGDAQLIRARGPIAGESYLDDKGKAALSLMMVEETLKAIASIDELSQSPAYWEKAVKTQRTNGSYYGVPVTEIYLGYFKAEDAFYLQVFSAKLPEELKPEDYKAILLGHKKYLEKRRKDIMTFAPFNTIEEAQIILASQSAALSSLN